MAGARERGLPTSCGGSVPRIPGRGSSNASATARRAAGLRPHARSVAPELDAAAAWSLAAGLSPRPKVRVADADHAGRALNRYTTELPLTAAAPERPYALYLTDCAGGYRLLGFDLDARHGPVGEDLSDLRDLLDRAGLERHVVCASGPGGGRHVWIALTTPAPAHLVNATARALAARLPSLDIAPLTNPLTGCLRPPGAPHRSAGRSQLLAGSLEELLTPRAGPAQLHALLALLGAPPARRAAGDPRTVAKDATGAPYLLGDRAALPGGSKAALDGPLSPEADASAALWTVLLGAARAHWHLSDLSPVLHAAPGLEHVRTARSGPLRAPRNAAEAGRLLARQWQRAVAHAAATPPAAGGDPTFEPRAAATVAAVAAIQGRAGACPGRWARDGGPSDRRVLDAACNQLLAAVRLDVDLDVRRLGELCGVSRETARRALHRLTTDGFLHLVEPAAGIRAARWGLGLPPSVASPGGVATGVSQADPRPGGAGPARAAWRHALRRRLAAVAHDVFTPTPGLGHHAGRVYAQLTGQPQPCHELIDGLGYPPRRLDHYLERLRDAGLARFGPGTVWRRRAADRDCVATTLGAGGALERRRHRHRLEREAWAWWLDELAWMHLPRSAKRRRRDPVLGQGVLGLTGLTFRQRHGAHPRRADGRADFAGAMHQLRVVDNGVVSVAA